MAISGKKIWIVFVTYLMLRNFSVTYLYKKVFCNVTIMTDSIRMYKTKLRLLYCDQWLAIKTMFLMLV